MDICCSLKTNKMNVTSLLITFLLCTSVLLTGLVSLIGFILYEETTSVYPETVEKFAVPCDDLSLSPDEDFETFDVKKNGLKTSLRDGRYMCSYENLRHLLSLVVERQSRVRLAKGLDECHYMSCGNESLAPKSGHLIAAFSGISQHQQNSDKILENGVVHWHKHSNNSYIDPSVSYRNGEITILEGRTYCIYASVHFNISRQINGQFRKLKHFTIRICRREKEHEQTLFGRTKLFNVNSTNAVSTLRIASHFDLSRGDNIYIKVSDGRQLLPFSKGNTFGLFPT